MGYVSLTTYNHTYVPPPPSIYNIHQYIHMWHITIPGQEPRQAGPRSHVLAASTPASAQHPLPAHQLDLWTLRDQDHLVSGLSSAQTFFRSFFHQLLQVIYSVFLGEIHQRSRVRNEPMIVPQFKVKCSQTRICHISSIISWTLLYCWQACARQILWTKMSGYLDTK